MGVEKPYADVTNIKKYNKNASMQDINNTDESFYGNNDLYCE